MRALFRISRAGDSQADSSRATGFLLKKLQEERGVDCGGLRAALKQLEFTGVLEIRQGDGTYVKG